MSAFRSEYLNWNISDIANALQIKEAEVREYFTDGRRVSFLLERRIVREILRGRLAPSEGASFDLFDRDGGKWEVRSISQGGIYFCPSYMVGSGRKFDETGFLMKLSEIKGYIVSDITCFPKVPIWIVPVASVNQWWKAGSLGMNSKITREKALQLIKGGC